MSPQKTDLANARLPRAVLLPGATYHGRIDLVAIDLVLAGKRPPSTLDDDHKLYAIVHRPGTAEALARALGIACHTVTRYRPAADGADGGPP
ncbi:hypothetical protein JHN59_11520 [Streptomyces sp. MBT49]|uniref:hypothetical protein n=1 Tax=unclassified Streptomyces TaxID=2593676 RepID=UPI00190CB636|nr:MULTISPECIES: hypothetical protein [unclassified Streptomyces]MBK3625464.1 hypothetical protein [Streptomyces sp. MBT49]MBK3633273.1 hypothetical protein [Streptomyces sp. MBT97]